MCDPNRNNPASRAFTRQHDVDRVFAWMDDSEGSCELVVSKPEDDEEAADSFSVDWQTVPRLVHPMGGHLPEKRMLKKCQQLESMAREVVRIVKGTFYLRLMID
jgi:hypothetical protein